MRINANKEIHKRKHDPFTVLVRVTIILAVVALVSYGAVSLCTAAVQNDYKTKRSEIEQQNAADEQEFNARMSALRNSGSAQVDPETGEITTVEPVYWERTIDDQLWRIEDESRTALENTSTVSLDRNALLTSGLLLVNPWHSLPDDYANVEGELVSVGNSSNWKIQVQDGNVKLFPSAFDALQKMIDGAKADGLEGYIVRESYRTNEEQSTLFQKQMDKLASKYSGDILIEQAKKGVNYPGTSEYQTGFSFKMDVYSKTDTELNNKKFQESDQGKWFTANCWKYGVIFRFPTADFPDSSWEDKSYKTGVTLQMSLYRYVGAAHAAAMKVLDYCLEEYVEFLIEHPHLCIYQDGALRYEIYRISSPEALASYELPVPNPASDYSASLDNMGGVVMSYFYQ